MTTSCIDAPPFGLVTDAALIAEHADATLYVVRFNYTLRDHLRRIAELQRPSGFANLSIIFNGVNYGAGYGYGYGYGGYGYGYYDDEKAGQNAHHQAPHEAHGRNGVIIESGKLKIENGK